jgi:hypothetical protein
MYSVQNCTGTQSVPVQWLLRPFSSEGSGRGVKIHTHPHLKTKLRISGSNLHYPMCSHGVISAFTPINFPGINFVLLLLLIILLGVKATGTYGWQLHRHL